MSFFCVQTLALRSYSTWVPAGPVGRPRMVGSRSKPKPKLTSRGPCTTSIRLRGLLSGSRRTSPVPITSLAASAVFSFSSRHDFIRSSVPQTWRRCKRWRCRRWRAGKPLSTTRTASTGTTNSPVSAESKPHDLIRPWGCSNTHAPFGCFVVAAIWQDTRSGTLPAQPLPSPWRGAEGGSRS